MSFTDQKPFTLTEDEYAKFQRVGKRLHCKLCDRDFRAGDWIRWVYANGTPGLGCGNFFVCQNCGENQENKVLLACARVSYGQAYKLAKQWDLI